jgi:hypothetical protein
VLNKKFLLAYIHIFPLITLTFIALIFFRVTWLIPLGMIIIQGFVNRSAGKRIARIYKMTSKSSKIFNAYSSILSEIEKEEFKSEMLKTQKKTLFTGNKSASSCIKKFSVLLEYFELRTNPQLHFFMNNILCWDFHWVWRIEKWKKRVGPDIHKWFEVVGIHEALSSFACAHFNFPDWTFPKIVESEFHLETKSAGHPLIPVKERVCNDIRLEGKENILIITGPNMAGKSTFLKTIGVNMVLAFAGSPVCAKSFKVSPLNLYTSMKVSDSLDKNLSLFYAELQRLKMILDAILRKEPVFFLIDEMLKGTNELDRQMGSIALIKQLVKNNSDGIIATHDLELTKLEKEYPQEVINYHFDGYIEGDKLLFDYILKKGICESFNALVLMKKIGIDI